MNARIYILSAIVLVANFMISSVDSVECYSCSSHSSGSACFTGKFEPDTIEKLTCSGITACQTIYNLNAAGDVVTVMRQCALVKCSFIGKNCYECEGNLCNSASSISKSVLLSFGAIIIASCLQKFNS